ncbi:MAG: hypothetical protein JWO36_1963 [Myxococcales bacterium]|nr:hypothetical protein [Myxococcales bacterium]
MVVPAEPLPWPERLTAWRWWTIALRGVAAILLGIFGVLLPGITFLSLVVVFGIYAIVDGVLTLTVGARVAESPHSAPVIARGIASIVAGLIALVWPGITALVLLLVIAAWALVSGILEVVTAVRLRKVLRHEWLLVVQGILSIGFGVILFISPAAGAIALGLWVGAYALVLGVLLVMAGFQMRRHQRDLPGPGAFAAA